jgi:membrane-associated phospholipid phosphatase
MHSRRRQARDEAVLLTVQRRFSGAGVVRGAQLVSLAGEHAATWLVVSAAGASFDAPRRGAWARAGTAALTAHGCAVVLKRIARRPRPAMVDLLVHAPTASSLSFPSAHAASTTAFVVALAPVAGRRVLVLPAVMGLSRIVLGVHYPSDVVVGCALGAAVATRVRSDA